MPEHKIGIIAGKGKLPLLFIKEARKKGYGTIVISADVENVPGSLRNIADKVYPVYAGDMGRIVKILKDENVSKVAFLGLIRHKGLIRKPSLDHRAKKILSGLQDWKADSVLNAVADDMRSEGIMVVDIPSFLSGLTVPMGILGRHKPDLRQWADIKFGFSLARNIAGLDIGQTVAVKQGTVVAVEAMEGTDKCLQRAGKIAGSGIIVVKVAKPKQDFRFDLPTIGIRTAKILMRIGASVLAVSADKTLIIDREEVIRICDRARISLVSLDDAGRCAG